MVEHSRKRPFSAAPMKQKAPKRRECRHRCSSLENPRPHLSKRETAQTPGAWRNPYTVPKGYYWLRVVEWVTLLGFASLGFISTLNWVLA